MDYQWTFSARWLFFFHFVQITKRKWFVSCNSHINFAFKLHVKFHAKQTVGGKTSLNLPVAMLPSLWSFWHSSRCSVNVRPLVSFLTNCNSPGLPTPAPKLKELYQVLLRGQSNCRQWRRPHQGTTRAGVGEPNLLFLLAFRENSNSQGVTSDHPEKL